MIIKYEYDYTRKNHDWQLQTDTTCKDRDPTGDDDDYHIEPWPYQYRLCHNTHKYNEGLWLSVRAIS